MSRTVPRVLIVARETDYQGLLKAHGTRGQVAFFLKAQGDSIEALEEDHTRIEDVIRRVQAAIPEHWTRQLVWRHDLDRFVFEPDDIILAVGQDGLVPNLAKYVDGQAVVGVNPLHDRFDGVLVQHSVDEVEHVLHLLCSNSARIENRVMVEAILDDGRSLRALNEIFIGHRSHQSARYRINYEDRTERQSSSGLIVCTGTGASGWAYSIRRGTGCKLPMPAPTEPSLAFFVREPFPSVCTGCDIRHGILKMCGDLVITSEMTEGGVVFGDGIENDRLEFSAGRRLRLRVAPGALRLVVSGSSPSM